MSKSKKKYSLKKNPQELQAWMYFRRRMALIQGKKGKGAYNRQDNRKAIEESMDI